MSGWADSRIRAILAAVLLIGVGCDRDPLVLAEKHFLRAQDYEKSDKIEEAIVELTRATQLKPDMVKARNNLARLYVRNGDINGAFREASAVIGYDRANIEALSMLGDILLWTGQFAEARKVAERILAAHPDNRKARLDLAESFIGLGELGLGKPEIERVLRADPTNARAHLDLAVVNMREKNWTDAEAQLRLSLSYQSDSIRVVLLLSQMLESLERVPDAEKTLKSFSESHRDRLDAMTALAKFYVKHQRLREAEELFKRIAESGNADPQQRGSLGAFYRSVGRVEDAQAEYLRVTGANPDDEINWLQLAETELALKRRPEARKILFDLTSREEAGDVRAWLRLADIETQDAKLDEAARVLAQAAIKYPNAPVVHYQLARVYQSQEKFDAAMTSYRVALRLSPDFADAAVALAELELRFGQPQRAIQSLADTLKKNPLAVIPNLLTSRSQVQLGQFRLAERNLVRLLEQQLPPAAQALAVEVLARVRFGQGRYEEAITLAVKSLESGNVTIEGLQVLGLSHFGLKQPKNGVASVQAYVQKAGQWTAGHDLLARLALWAQDYDLAERSYRTLLDLDTQATSALLGIGTVYERRQQYPRAREYFERVARLEPQNAEAHFRLGAVSVAMQDWQRAISEYKRALEHDPSSASGMNNLAWIYLEHTDEHHEALRLAQDARRLQPKDPRIADTLAWIYVKQGRASRALPLLEECLAAKPDDAYCHYHLGVVHADLGRMADARRELEAALRTLEPFDGSADARALLDRIMKTRK